MKNKFIIPLLLVVFFLTSCESLVFQEEASSKDPFKNFDYMWNECNEKYSYFELKNIDWNQVKRKYRPLLYKEMKEDSLFKVMAAMLRELKDDHTNLIASFNLSFFGVHREGPDNFDWRIIQDNYLPRNYYVSGPFRHDFLKNTKQQIGYIRFSSFTGGISSSNLDFALARYAKTKGIILDLRENGGGAVRDVFSLLSRFIDKKTLLFYSRIKSGVGHNDFSAPEAAYLEPVKSGVRYLRKVIMLVDRGTYSAGSFTSLGTKAIPNMILMGDTTGGGLGLPNGGQLPNGWTYRFSITQSLDLNKNPAYENGVPPDIYATVNWSNRKKDEVIELAVKEILKK